MIIAFVGTPGSGKSYEAVQKILENLKLGRKIYTNIDGLEQPDKREAIKAYCNLTDFQVETLLNHLDEEQVVNFWDHCEKGSLIVIDEVHKYFSNREWQSEKNVIFTKWASTHRHEGFDLVLVTQDAEKVDKHCRSLIEWTYLYRKMNQFGGMLDNRYVVYAFMGDQTTKMLSKQVKKYKKEVFPCYSSYTGSDVKELGIMKGVNILKHPVMFAIPVVFVVFIVFFFKSGFSDGEIIPGITAAKALTNIDHSNGSVVRNDVRNSDNVVRNDVRNDVRQGNSGYLSPRAALIAEHTRDDSPLDVVVKWLLPGGKIVFTNNWTQPEGAKFVARM